MLDRIVGAVAVWADGRVPACDPVKVSCYQWGMTGAYLCHRHALVPELMYVLVCYLAEIRRMR